jgi:HEAT repeat protein
VIERLGRPWAVEPMLAALRGLDEAGERRSAPRIGIARALGVAGDQRAEPALVRLLATGSLEERISEALGKVGIQRSVPALEGVLDDPAWWVRANAASALRELGEPGHAALERALKHEDRYARDRAREALALDRMGMPVA